MHVNEPNTIFLQNRPIIEVTKLSNNEVLAFHLKVHELSISQWDVPETVSDPVAEVQSQMIRALDQFKVHDVEEEVLYNGLELHMSWLSAPSTDSMGLRVEHLFLSALTLKEELYLSFEHVVPVEALEGEQSIFRVNSEAVDLEEFPVDCSGGQDQCVVLFADFATAK